MRSGRYRTHQTTIHRWRRAGKLTRRDVAEHELPAAPGQDPVIALPQPEMLTLERQAHALAACAERIVSPWAERVRTLVR